MQVEIPIIVQAGRSTDRDKKVYRVQPLFFDNLVEQDRRLLTTLRRNAERDFIYDLLSENRESLAIHLGALALQEGVVWARIEAVKWAFERDGIDVTDVYQEGDTLQVSASIGIALYPQDGTHMDTLIKHADVAMYHVKGQGKNGRAKWLPLGCRRAAVPTKGEAAEEL